MARSRPDRDRRRSDRGSSLRTTLLGLAVLAIGAPLGVAPSSAQFLDSVPTPESHFGFVPGADRRLADWSELLAYYDLLADASPRVTIDTIGHSTRGLPLVMLTITSPGNQERLSEIRDVHRRLADPRVIGDTAELAYLKRQARTVVMITSHIHATEVGAGQMPANLAYRLASEASPETLQVLDEVVLLLVPSLNPDGTQMVAQWYREYVGTEFEGTDPVGLYHHYVGHDNNRDWYAFTQVETQHVVEKAHNVWRPMIVHDIHQMGEQGPRIFVPPYVDPFERNVDPLLVTAINQLGSYMAAELSLRGFEGVSTGLDFDLFTPARAYSHYHGGVRILSETASARLASPIQLGTGNGVGWHPGPARMTEPMPWRGGDWGLPQIVAYQEAAAMALLGNAARNRRFWVDNFYEVNRRAVGGWPEWPSHWVIPDVPGNRTGLDALLRILTIGSVEVRRSEGAFVTDERAFPTGTFVIAMNQPYAAWAQTLLEVQDYPDPGNGYLGAPARPYDVTAHTLPLLMGVEAVPVTGPLEARLSDPIEQVDAVYQPLIALSAERAPRIGLYQGSRESIPAGWTRWLFDQHALRYTALDNRDVRAGGLRNRYDVIVLQDQLPTVIRNGWRVGQVPSRFAGGVGEEGLDALRRFVLEGGRLVAIEAATELVIDLFALSIRNRLAGVPAASFNIPGSIVGLERTGAHPIASGVPESTGAWFGRSSRAFDVSQSSTTVVARYVTGDPRRSGLVTGGEHIAGHPAIVEVRVGGGSIVLFGFQPNYRGQSIATWPFLFNSLLW